LSAAGDPLERLAGVVDFEVFRGSLVAALRRCVRGIGGLTLFDPVLMFKCGSRGDRARHSAMMSPTIPI